MTSSSGCKATWDVQLYRKSLSAWKFLVLWNIDQRQLIKYEESWRYNDPCGNTVRIHFSYDPCFPSPLNSFKFKRHSSVTQMLTVFIVATSHEILHNKPSSNRTQLGLVLWCIVALIHKQRCRVTRNIDDTRLPFLQVKMQLLYLLHKWLQFDKNSGPNSLMDYVTFFGGTNR